MEKKYNKSIHLKNLILVISWDKIFIKYIFIDMLSHIISSIPDGWLGFL